MIYATGDLHGNSLRFQPQYFPEQSEMTKDDYMIVCGDFGCVWNGDKSDDPQLDRLEALPFTVLFVDGNHENFDALNEHPLEQWHGGRVHKIRPHVIRLMRGQAFELQGHTFFTMGGAQSHDIADGILDMDSPNFYEPHFMVAGGTSVRRRIRGSPADDGTAGLEGRLRHYTLRTDSDSAENQRRFQTRQADGILGRSSQPQPVPLLAVRALPRQPSYRRKVCHAL